jgi:hypothetical protein
VFRVGRAWFGNWVQALPLLCRGFCKNGSNCKFVHGGFADSVDGPHGPIVGSPSKLEELELHEEMMRLKAAGSAAKIGFAAVHGWAVTPSAYNKYMNFLLQQQNDPQRYAGDDPSCSFNLLSVFVT